MRRFFLILPLLAILGLFIAPETIYAESVVVDGPINIFERVYEEITLRVKLNKKAKADYLIYLTEKRFAEIKWIFENKKFVLVEDVSSRYSTFLGRATEYIVANKLTDRRSQLVLRLPEHSEAFGEFQKNFEFESGWWLLMQHSINSIDIYSNKLKEI